MEPMDSEDIIYRSLPGHCPRYQWTMSTLSTERESMDKVQGVHGHSPGRWWTIPNESMEIGKSEWAPWTLSRVSMDIVQTFH